jgi:acyl carrier protein
MSSNDLKLRNLLVEILLLDDEEYRDDYGPDQIRAWDSLASVNIATAIDEEFGQSLSPEEIVSLKSIGHIKSILRSRGFQFDP